MAFNSSTTKVAKKRLVKLVEAKVNGKLSVDDKSELERVLDGVGNACVVSTDKIGEVYQIMGNVSVSALALTKEKRVVSLNGILDFNERVTAGDADGVFCVPTIKDIKLIKESDRVVVVTIVVGLALYGVVYEEVLYLSGEEADYYVTHNTTKLTKLMASGNSNFSVSEPIKNQNAIIANYGKVQINKVTPFENYCLIEGTANINLFVEDGDQLKKQQHSIDFSQEVPLLNVISEAIVSADAYIKSVNITGDEEKVIDANIDVMVWGFSNYDQDFILDIFSDKKEVNKTTVSLDYEKINPMKLFSDRKTIDFDCVNKKRMDEVLAITKLVAKPDQVNIVSNVANITGAIEATVIYKNYDNDEMNTTTLSNGFELSVPVDQESEDDQVDLKIDVYEVVAKNKAGKELSLVVDFEVVSIVSNCGTTQYVSKIENGEDYSKNRSSIIVYKPNGTETVFNIAKKLQISPDVLRAQNPNIEDGYNGQVVVFRKV